MAFTVHLVYQTLNFAFPNYLIVGTLSRFLGFIIFRTQSDKEIFSWKQRQRHQCGFWPGNAWIFAVCVSETCLKVFGFPPHKVEPKAAKSSVSTQKIKTIVIQILFNKENCSLITSLFAYRLLFEVNSSFRLPKEVPETAL